MIRRLWPCSSVVILAFLPLTVLPLLLGLAVLALRRPLLILLLGLAIWVYVWLVRVRVVLPLLLDEMIRVLRIANYTGRARGRRHLVRVDRVIITRLRMSVRGWDSGGDCWGIVRMLDEIDFLHPIGRPQINSQDEMAMINIATQCQ